ncbi:flagellar basal-body MS-ring/collar protein FliF [Tepidibacillus sp. HK-1]|uniref:flagellar basal-body MS-ring/collar protein FliF n=1 Tax=Tepidibacillus sp. HK-1 TaxID=1883407 RepID=UPI000852E9C7|nr:flagellar basal-body MS-ring/collar protein FliF [Tepidibacillus sp. HK-1]GBF11598.1 flagellar M-ring protein [Tepidibacillus sp. HK-1]
MNDFLMKYKTRFLNFWQPLEKKRKIMLISTAILLLSSLTIYTILATRTQYELAFRDLNEKQAGTIVKKLDEMGVPYQLSAGGTSILVPEAQVSKVKVTLAQEDVLGSGNIYSKFWDNSSFGMTDSQFKVLERGAIEQELRDLIVNGIKGIKDAQVMITVPEEKVFYSEDQDKSTASVVVDVDPSEQLSPNQIKSMYKLISLSVPNLPVENITVVDQYGETLEYITNDQGSINLNSYDQQRQIQLKFQQDLKKDLERMLGTVLGQDKVIVTVFAKMNFDQEKTVQNLKEPVIDGRGIERSVEKIQDSFTGQGSTPGGIAGTGNTQVPTYQSGDSNAGSSEHLEERINYDVNEITKEIVSSPYRLEDLSINVVVDLKDDTDPNSQAAQTKQAIRDLIKPIVLAAIGNQSDNSLNQTAIDQKIAVVAHTFQSQSPLVNNNGGSMNPLLFYGAIGLSVLAIGGVSYTVARRRRKKREDEEELVSTEVNPPEFDFTPVLTEEAALLQEIQKLAKQKPEEFTKLVRAWLSKE